MQLGAQTVKKYDRVTLRLFDETHRKDKAILNLVLIFDSKILSFSFEVKMIGYF